MKWGMEKVLFSYLNGNKENSSNRRNSQQEMSKMDEDDRQWLEIVSPKYGLSMEIQERVRIY